MKKINMLFFILPIIISSNVCAEIYKDKDGHVTGYTSTDSRGGTIYKDKDGHAIGSKK